jgi:transcription elongation factor GreA
VEGTEQKPTLAEAAEAFLAHLSPQERAQTQAEILKFVRWLGSSRRVEDISPVDVASYGEQITPSAAKPLRSFLTYVRKKSYSSASLAPHLRAKKTSPKKPVAVCQTAGQGQVTLTAQGYAKLERELANLKSQNSQVVEEIQRAAADKDFRENAPLAAAREQKSHLDGRIKEIESLLSQAKIMDEVHDATRAKLGDTVVLRDLSSTKESTYTLVDPREANPARGRLSVASPLGKAILDKEMGETVEVAAPAGTFSCRIESILASSTEREIRLQADKKVAGADK